MLTSRGFSLQSGSLIMLLTSAIVFPHPPLVLLSFFLLFASSFHAIIVHSSYLSKIKPEDFTAHRRVSSSSSLPGKEINVEVEVVYAGRLRIFCLVEEFFHKALTVKGSTFWSGTLEASSAKLSYSVKAEKRGVYDVGPVVVKVVDAHGLCSKEVKLGPVYELVFMPSIKKMKGVPRGPKVPSSLFHAGSSTNPFTGPEEDFIEVREYTPGDGMRHIDWKAMARSSKDQIYIKRFERQEQADVLLVLRGNPLEGVNDRLVGVTASFAKFFIDAGDRVGLVASAGKIISVMPSGGKAHLRRIMRGLAEAIYSPSAEPMVSEVSKVLARARMGSMVVVVGWPEKELLESVVEACRGRADRALILTPTYSSMAKALNIADAEALLEEVDVAWKEAFLRRKLEGIVVVRAPMEALEVSLMEALRFLRYRRGFAA